MSIGDGRSPLNKYCGVYPFFSAYDQPYNSQITTLNTPRGVREGLNQYGAKISLFSDLFFNIFDVKIPLRSAVSVRQKLIDLMSCPISPENLEIIIELGDRMLDAWASPTPDGEFGGAEDWNTTNWNPCPQLCCTCEGQGPFTNGLPSCEWADGGPMTVRNLCRYRDLCLGPPVIANDAVGNANCQCGGPENTGDAPCGTPIVEQLTCISLDTEPFEFGYCGAGWERNTCQCSNSGLTDDLIKSVKMYLNSTDYVCVPVSYTDFSGYELCDGES
jgi:hypothetical protein